MTAFSGINQSTVPSTSRRGLLAGAAGGFALVAAGQPAWAVDTMRPGALRVPALAHRDRQVVRGIRPARALGDLRVLSEGIGPRIGGTASEQAALNTPSPPCAARAATTYGSSPLQSPTSSWPTSATRTTS